MNTFTLKIIASDKVFFHGKCNLLIIPGIDGEMGVMAHHLSMITAVNVGELRYTTQDGEIHKAAVGKGFVQMINNRASVFVEYAEKPENIDIQRAQEAKDRALEQLRQKQSIREHYHTQASLARAMSRLKVTGRYNQ